MTRRGEAAKPMSLEDITAKACKGDLRQFFVDRQRAQKKLFSSLSEKDQKAEIGFADEQAEAVINKVTTTIATRGFQHSKTSVGKWTVDGSFITLQTKLPATPENVNMLLAAKELVVVHVDPERFYGERAPTLAEKDQPSFLDQAETPEQRRRREEIDEHDAEQERLLGQFKPLAEAPPTLDNDTGDVVEDAPLPGLAVAPTTAPAPAMTEAERAAYDRGVARRAHGGVRTLPEDLLDKDVAGDSAEAKAFHGGYDAEPAEPEEAAAPAGKPKRRGRRTVAEAVAARQAAVAGADAPGTYQPA